MLEDNNLIPEITDEKTENLVSEETSLIAVDTKELAQGIIEARDKEALQRQFDAFNIAQSKKNALRIIKLNKLLDNVENQAIERFEKRPDQVSNKELLDYMQVVASQIDRSQKYIDNLDDKPMITIKNQKNEVNVNIGTDLNRDNKEHVVDAIKLILSQLNDNQDNQVPENMIFAEAETIPEEPESMTYDSDILNNPDEFED